MARRTSNACRGSRAGWWRSGRRDRGRVRVRLEKNEDEEDEDEDEDERAWQIMELNPNHEVVRQVRGQWHKIAALIMVKLGKTELEITLADVEKIMSNTNIVLDARGATDSFKVRIVDDKTAAELARREGGRLCDN